MRGDKHDVFEPTHGSAPKYAGQYKVNPIAMLLTVKLMFDWLNETERAKQLEAAIARVIAEGKVRTYEKHVRSPRRHGLAVARAAKLLRSTSLKRSPNTQGNQAERALEEEPEVTLAYPRGLMKLQRMSF